MTRPIALGLLLCLSGTVHAQEPTQPSDVPRTERAEPRLQLRAVTELGFLGVHAHGYRSGTAGTLFNFREEGGQDVLFSFARLSAELTWSGRHTAVLLVQPLELNTEVVFERDVTVDETTFPAGTPMNLRYSFPFYRASYLYDLLAGPGRELAVGGSLQIRDATIVFTSADGRLRRDNRDVGPVPLLKARGRWELGPRYWLGFEADGIYAPIQYLNGSDNEATGALLDLSLRGGVRLTDAVEVFLNLRYLGGGARSTDEEEALREPGNGFTSNWLDFTSVSLGAAYRLPVSD